MAELCVVALSDSQAAEFGVELVDADTLFRSSDIISLHAPITKATDDFVNAARLASIQLHPMIVNSARGRRALAGQPPRCPVPLP
jgi:D-3-phosphoglycerate dehydrogenase / 2-oxoglutarate reductase